MLMDGGVGFMQGPDDRNPTGAFALSRRTSHDHG